MALTQFCIGNRTNRGCYRLSYRGRGTGQVVSDFHLGLFFGTLFAVGTTGFVMLALGRRSQRGGVLLLTFAIAAGCLAGCVFLQPNPPQLEACWKSLLTPKGEPRDTWATVYTDTGRPIQVVANDEEDFPTEERRAQEAEIGRKFPFTLIRTAEHDPGSNCYGWVFTGGRYWINGRDVENILADNGYQRVYEPQSDDVIIYRGKIGEVIHAAVVRSTGDLVMIEGKWSCMGVYLHAADQYPYSQSYDYYRSDRKGHLLKLPD